MVVQEYGLGLGQPQLAVSNAPSDPDVSQPEATTAFQLIAPQLLVVALVIVEIALLQQSAQHDRLLGLFVPISRPRPGRYSRPVLNAFLN
jgi:hypothetical protein